jgi:hypothetical protein
MALLFGLAERAEVLNWLPQSQAQLHLLKPQYKAALLQEQLAEWADLSLAAVLAEAAEAEAAHLISDLAVPVGAELITLPLIMPLA